MAKDQLFLIAPSFDDPRRSDGPFVCPFCNQVEGLLASFPERASGIEVQRVPFARPRQPVIAVVGEDNQGLPLLVYGDHPPEGAQRHGDVHFVSDTRQILEQLAQRHGFPRLHGPAA